MTDCVVTISGLPGSGTSSVCELLSKQTGWHRLNAGKIFRQLAEADEISLSELGRRAQKDPDVDRRLDASMIRATRTPSGGLILEGRLTGWMVTKAEVAALKVWIHADISVRAQRVGCRDGQAIEQATKGVVERERCEIVRYKQHHSIDIADLSIYDMIIDSEFQTVEHISRLILQRISDAQLG